MTAVVCKYEKPSIKHLANIEEAQEREDFIPGTKRSGWYDEEGKWIGWGDLTRQEMGTIARALKNDERFIVLHEEDSYRRFLKCSLPDWKNTPRNEDAPGLDYVAAHALFIIEKRFIFLVNNVHPKRGVESWGWGVRYQFIDPATAQEKILGAQLETVH